MDRTRGGVTAGVSAVLRADAPKDYALLRLDKPIGDTYGWLELDTTTVPDTSQSVKLISHNRGRSKEIVRRNTEIVDIPADHPLANVPFALAYLSDSEGGSSGSPVFLREGTGVIAIHHSGWTRRDVPDFNAGSLMSYIVPEIRPWLPGNRTPDLVVEVPRVTKDWLLPGESFTLSATVRNYGGVDSSATTLQFYESFDSSITTADVEVGVGFVGSLGPFETSEVSVTLTAPISLATYYYGACVDAVADETTTDNNCSTSTSVIVSTTPQTTALLPNYPNPFNPETWIPYHLATDAAVALTIYDVRGSVVRTLTLGHQLAGVYESRGRAAYWDGKNQIGEPVASGLYFYTLTAGEFTATRKLLIAK